MMANIDSLLLPSLSHAHKLDLTTFSPSKLTFPALINWTNIDISGNITESTPPVLKYCTYALHISTSLSTLNCAPANNAYTRVTTQQKADHLPSSLAPSYSCSKHTNAPQEDADWECSFKLLFRLGLGLGFGVPVFLIVAILAWVFGSGTCIGGHGV